jgi:PTH2 family peptidyl-tRNA hydrolase
MGIKQVIVIRKDLNCRKGKMIAQGAHASLKAFQLAAATDTHLNDLDGFKKIVVSVNSEKELQDIYQYSQVYFLPAAIILDEGLTEFHNVPTYTAVAIGPCDERTVDLITGQLPLL